MHGKVSMVVPCYNKKVYISEMFDSIIAQEWDNIELILINDGSTDGTREVIAAYEPRFRIRGYDVVVIDQSNAGVCAATKAGLEIVTGDYICVVDSDDELDSKYVSMMAGWLEEHADYDIACCGLICYTGIGKNKVFGSKWMPPEQDVVITTDDYLKKNIYSAVWGYMLRKEYFYRCRILESYYTHSMGSHEPGFMIPMSSFNGLIHFIRLPLYRHSRDDINSHSLHDTFEKFKKHIEEYYSLCKIAINRLPDEIADAERKNELCDYANYFMHKKLYQNFTQFTDGKFYQKQLFTALLESAQACVVIGEQIPKEGVKNKERLLLLAVKNIMQKKTPPVIEKPQNRVIAYGALGKAAFGILPLLSNTFLEPTDLWDINGDGITVKKPEFDRLRENDILLCFPAGTIENELKQEFNKLTCRKVYNSDIWDWLANLFFIKKQYTNNLMK